MKNNNFKWLLFASLALVACSEDVDDNRIVEEPVSAGSADFSKFVSLGNSLTAGFSDNALFIKGQENSFPNIMAAEFAKVGGGEFKIPYMADNLGGFQSGGVQVPGFATRLFFNGSGPVNVPGTPGTDISVSIAGQGPYNNLGVPGAKSFHLAFPGYGTLNPYFGRFATSTTATVIGDAVAQNPTFFSLWIGNNDVLAYATSGGDGTDQTGNPNPATYGNNDITDPGVFAATYSGLLDQLTANGAKGVVANIPNVTTVPYFKTVPYNPLSPSALGGESNINLLNQQLYGPLNGIFTAYGEPDRVNLLSSTSANPILIHDNDAIDRTTEIADALTPVLGAPTATAFGMIFGKSRQATANDLVVLPASSVIGTVNASSPSPLININGVSFPMANRWVLTPHEQQKVQTATNAFNASIQNLAASKGLAFVDANAILNQIATTGGYPSGGFIFKSDFIFGNTFSLDGVHMSPRANALVANKMMDAINATYGSTFRPVSLSAYPILYGASIP